MQDIADIRISADSGADGTVIQVDGGLSLTTAGALREALLEGLRPGARTVLQAAGVTSVDISGLQLLCSAHGTYISHGASFQVDRPSEVLWEGVRGAGYGDQKSVCPYRRDGSCLWKR